MTGKPDTTIRRIAERSVGDVEVVNQILDQGLVCHVAYMRDDRPIVIPTLYARDGDRILLHGSNSSGLVRAVRQGSPLSVAVTHIEALVVARSGFHSSANYRSVVVHGEGTILDGEEHRRALDVLVEAMIPGRVADIRPPTDQEMRQTTVIAMPLDAVSAKVRTGGPKDDPADLGSDVWAGVVPLKTISGTPIPAEDLVGEPAIPDYLIDYRR